MSDEVRKKWDIIETYLNFLMKLIVFERFFVFLQHKHLKILIMAQIGAFNQAQLQLLDMMSFVKSPEALDDLNKAISDYFAKKADEELEKMWSEGSLNDEKIESFRHLHERTSYNKPTL